MHTASLLLPVSHTRAPQPRGAYSAPLPMRTVAARILSVAGRLAHPGRAVGDAALVLGDGARAARVERVAAARSRVALLFRLAQRRGQREEGAPLLRVGLHDVVAALQHHRRLARPAIAVHAAARAIRAHRAAQLTRRGLVGHGRGLPVAGWGVAAAAGVLRRGERNYILGRHARHLD